jgi:hypothetical protein
MSLKNTSPLRKYYYVALKQTYEELGEDGKVRVTTEDGRSGIFHYSGKYLEGELTQANIHMLMWCAGPTIPDECNYRWHEVPVDINRPSGWPENLEKALAHQIG